MPESCFLCGSAVETPEYKTTRLQVARCSGCGHRFAKHAGGAPANDYYEHTPEQEKFVTSLSETRRRQAKYLLARIGPRLAKTDSWLDFGCGRGLFLGEARAFGLEALSGFEASSVSGQWMKSRGFPMADGLPGEFWPKWDSLATKPKIVSFFDVLEHFEGRSSLEALRRLQAELPGLEWIVIKVPVSDGALFRLAHAIRGQVPGPYETMFQVGTNPPHYHYFSRASLRLFVEKAGLAAELEWTDPDVDNLFHRIPSVSWLPGGRIAALTLRAFAGDTAVVCARVPRRA